jgi:hypothetical protein
MHFVTGAAAREPKPAFSRYAETTTGRFGSRLKAANTEESYHGRLRYPWAVPVFPAMGSRS